MRAWAAEEAVINAALIQSAAVWGGEELQARRGEIAAELQAFGKRAAPLPAMAERVKLFKEFAASMSGSQPAPANVEDGPQPSGRGHETLTTTG